jgi:ankyrin repeat protein
MQEAVLKPSLKCKNYQDLFAAVRIDDLDTCQRLIADLTDLSVRMDLPSQNYLWIFAGRPYLIQVCALYGALRCFVLLLDSGCPHDVKDFKGRHLLHYVFAGGSRDILNHLVQRDSHLQFQCPDLQSIYPAHFAAMFGRLELLQWLNAHNIPLNPAGQSESTPLMWACKEGHLDCVKYLVANGGKPTEATYGGWTPLHYAVSRNQASVAEWLLQCPRVKPDAATSRGETPIKVAFEKDAAECCSLLVDRGCNLYVSSGFSEALDDDWDPEGYEDMYDDRDLVLVAAGAGKKRILGMLLQKPRVMEGFGHLEFDQFFRACLGNVNDDIVEGLCAALKPGIEIPSEILEKAVAKLIKKSFGVKAIAAVRSLGEVGKDWTDQGGGSWLHLAIQHGNVQVLRYLLDWGVDANLRDEWGKTAVDYVMVAGNATGAAIARAMAAGHSLVPSRGTNSSGSQ